MNPKWYRSVIPSCCLDAVNDKSNYFANLVVYYQKRDKKQTEDETLIEYDEKLAPVALWLAHWHVVPKVTFNQVLVLSLLHYPLYFICQLERLFAKTILCLDMCKVV